MTQASPNCWSYLKQQAGASESAPGALSSILSIAGCGGCNLQMSGPRELHTAFDGTLLAHSLAAQNLLTAPGQA